jgi:AcrR family transcriptional regulator
MSSPGLRERKKQKTRWSIQEHALRLFAEQGYEATTIDQIAAAAEISPSTFFRYFKTKEDLVLEDQYDPMIEAMVRAAPAELGPVAALRYAIREGYAMLDAAEHERIASRVALSMSHPSIRARALDLFFVNAEQLARAMAPRLGRPPEDLVVSAFAGAVVGALIVAMQTWRAEEQRTPFNLVMDQALAVLEPGPAKLTG